jgi:hypothetical protein
MKWDKTCTPPKAWYVEDGDWVPVDPALVRQCEKCFDWFVADQLSDQKVCSVGCKLTLLESRKGEKNEEIKKS